MSATSRLCSEWKIWWMALSAMFSLHRPSPQAKCAASISSSYVPAGWCVKSADGVSSASGAGATGGVAGLLSLSCGDGSALCAMSVRNGVSKRSTLLGTGTGAARLPSTRPVLVTYCGSPRAGPGMNLPYGSVASIGTLVTSRSTSASPSSVRGLLLHCRPGSHARAAVRRPLVGQPGRQPTEHPAGRHRAVAELNAYSRRNTWCEGCEV